MDEPMRYAGAWFALLLLATAVALACSDALTEEDAATKDVASSTPSAAPTVASPTIPFVTPPFWDCVGTPPPGWMTPASASGSGCVLLPTPDHCARLTVGGREVCLPHGTSYGGLGPPLCTPEEPCDFVSVYVVTYAGSLVRWQTRPKEDGTQAIELLEWSVLPEHEAAFADLRAAFEALGQGAP